MSSSPKPYGKSGPALKFNVPPPVMRYAGRCRYAAAAPSRAVSIVRNTMNSARWQFITGGCTIATRMKSAEDCRRYIDHKRFPRRQGSQLVRDSTPQPFLSLRNPAVCVEGGSPAWKPTRTANAATTATATTCDWHRANPFSILCSHLVRFLLVTDLRIGNRVGHGSEPT